MDSSCRTTVSFPVSTQRTQPTTNQPGIIRRVEKSKRRRLPRPQRQSNSHHPLQEPAEEKARRRAAKPADIRLRAVWEQQVKAEQNLPLCCRRMWRTIFRYNIRAQYSNF